MAQNKILSTGVLAPDSQLEAAQVDVVNIDPTLSQTVTVEVFDWGVDPVSSNPAPVVVTPPNPVTIGPHSHQSFTVPPTASIFSRPRHFYEIRVTIPDDRQLMVNCFAFGLNGTVIAGNTVLHEELAEIAGPMSHTVGHLTGMIDAVADAGADNTGATDATTTLGNAVAMCFGYPTMAALNAALPPATTSGRTPMKWLYIPPGEYKLLEALTLQCMVGLVIRGGGGGGITPGGPALTRLSVEGGTASDPLIAGVDLNGIAYSTFSDFYVVGNGDVQALIYLHWDPTRAAFPTQVNAFYNVGAVSGNGLFREAAWQIGALKGDGATGVDVAGTHLFHCGASGAYSSVRGDLTLVGGIPKKDLYFQRGFRFGDWDGIRANNLIHHAHSLFANGCKYGVDWSGAECPIYGGEIAGNDVDCFASSPPGCYITVKNIRSEVSGRFFATPPGVGTAASFHASIEDCCWAVADSYGNAVVSIVKSATANTLLDPQGWSANIWQGYIARITTGVGAVQERQIIANSSCQLTLASSWTTIPGAGAIYAITKAATGGTAAIDGMSGSLVKTGEKWSANQWRGWYVYLLSGPGKGQVGWVDSSTADTLQINNHNADVPLPGWTAAPDINTAFAIGLVPPDGEFIRWGFPGVFRISGLTAAHSIYSLFGTRHRIALTPQFRRCIALIDGVTLGETARAQAFSNATPMAALDVRGWESVDAAGQILEASEAGRILTNAGEAVDVKTLSGMPAVTLDQFQDHVRVDATAGAVAVTLPDATRFAGRRFTVKKIDASTNSVTIQGPSGQTINGSVSMSTTTPWAAFRLYSTGDNWETD
jgi:hypothetical protein